MTLLLALAWATPSHSARTTLSCASCHVSPTGGGLRTPMGWHYGRGLATFEGLEANREPDPAVAAGFDGRGLYYMRHYYDDDVEMVERSAFPMQAEVYLMGRRGHHVGYLDIGLHADEQRLTVLGREVDLPPRTRLEYLRVRELYWMVDRLPHGVYARAGRIQPPHGWRIPDHTSFTRRRLGFEQDHQVFALEAGARPGRVEASWAVYRQGVVGWPGDRAYDPELRNPRRSGWGSSGLLTVRAGSLRVGVSATTTRPDEGSPQIIVGPLYAWQRGDLALLGEVDLRHQEDGLGLFSYHEVFWTLNPSLTASLKLDWRAEGLRTEDGDGATRLTAGMIWAVWPHVHLEMQVLQQYEDDRFGVYGLHAEGAILMVHAWL